MGVWEGNSGVGAAREWSPLDNSAVAACGGSRAGEGTDDTGLDEGGGACRQAAGALPGSLGSMVPHTRKEDGTTERRSPLNTG